jgi:hypothetical protein
VHCALGQLLWLWPDSFLFKCANHDVVWAFVTAAGLVANIVKVARRAHRNFAGNPRFPIRPGTGIGVPIRRAGGFLVSYSALVAQGTVTPGTARAGGQVPARGPHLVRVSRGIRGFRHFKFGALSCHRRMPHIGHKLRPCMGMGPFNVQRGPAHPLLPYRHKAAVYFNRGSATDPPRRCKRHLSLPKSAFFVQITTFYFRGKVR